MRRGNFECTPKRLAEPGNGDGAHARCEKHTRPDPERTKIAGVTKCAFRRRRSSRRPAHSAEASAESLAAEFLSIRKFLNHGRQGAVGAVRYEGEPAARRSKSRRYSDTSWRESFRLA